MADSKKGARPGAYSCLNNHNCLNPQAGSLCHRRLCHPRWRPGGSASGALSIPFNNPCLIVAAGFSLEAIAKPHSPQKGHSERSEESHILIALRSFTSFRMTIKPGFAITFRAAKARRLCHQRFFLGQPGARRCNGPMANSVRQGFC